MWEPDDHVQWAAEDIQIFDGSCTVGTGEDVAEVGYRLLMNRKPRATENTLLILYHGNGEICEDYTDWADIYRVFPCSRGLRTPLWQRSAFEMFGQCWRHADFRLPRLWLVSF